MTVEQLRPVVSQLHAMRSDAGLPPDGFTVSFALAEPTTAAAIR